MGSTRRFARLVAPAFVALACNAVLGLDDLPLKDAGSGDGGEDPGLGGKGGASAAGGKGGSAGRGGTAGRGGSSAGGDAGEGGENGASGGSAGSDLGGTGGAGGGIAGGSSGTGGSGGTGGDTGGSGGTAGQSGSSGTGGSGGTACDLSDVGKSRQALPNPITGAFTATADKVWTLNDYVVVEAGGELTIESCTRIEGAAPGNPGNAGALFIARGAKIFANGTATRPILFTTEAAAPNRAAGQWGGVVLLGDAPINADGTFEAPFQGITDNRFLYGGANSAGDSGSLSYVRIEFSGHVLQENVYAIAGLALAGVGSATTIDHVMVSNTRDDCFDWFGGSVRTNYLVCNDPGDDYFDIDQGWVGGGEYWFGRREHAAIESGDPYGIEADATNDASSPRTDFDVTSAILCGTGQAVTTSQPQFGMVLRERVRTDFASILLLGFEYGIDTRDAVAATDIKISDSAFWGLLNPGGVGDPDAGGNDDSGFVDSSPFTSGTFNSQPNPGFFTLSECLDPTGPTSAVTSDTYWRWLEEDWLDWSTE